jgi:hypothetical protein
MDASANELIEELRERCESVLSILEGMQGDMPGNLAYQSHSSCHSYRGPF